MLLSTVILFCTLCTSSRVYAYFGQPLSYGIDDLFDVMGTATIDEFSVNDGNVVMSVTTEKVIDEDEIWVLDFQAYEMADGSTAVDTTVPPRLLPDNTGTCSNIFAQTADFYKDAYEPALPGSKVLYNAFAKGVPTDGRRLDDYIYTGDVDTLLECMNTDSEKVWIHSVYQDYVEFNATLYMTNVRPKYINKPVIASYIESYVVLYWRLLRIALSRFLISSTERLRPIFQYATVSAVYINDDPDQGVDRSRAEVELNLKTVSNSDEEFIPVFKYGSLVYTSPNPKNTLSHITSQPDRGCNIRLQTSHTYIMTASSNSGAAAETGTLNDDFHWAPSAADSEPWIQVEIEGVTPFVSGVLTQGSGISPSYVTSYRVDYSYDDSVWFTVGTFANANFDSSTIVTNYFDTPVLASYIKIYPLSSENDKTMRIELLGCEANNRDPYDLGLEFSPACDYTEYPGQCTQLWEFFMVLNVDEGSVTSDRPIDATGNFQFRYATHLCPGREIDVDTCELLDIPDAIISSEITLQSTVQLTDAGQDSPWLIVKRVYPNEETSINLVGGYRPGVSHLDTVTVDIAFYPEFLRTNLELELTLFMVCIGQYDTDPDGCLSAPTEERYTSFVSSDFQYTLSGTVTTLDSSNIEETTQELLNYDYDRSAEVYKIQFINKALSALTRDYTITTVFQLTERSRKRRDLSLRVRRDLESNSMKPNIHSVYLLDRGCPSTAEHDPENLDCICMNGYVYSNEKFECVVINGVVELPDHRNVTNSNDQSPAAVNPVEENAGDHSSAPVLRPVAATLFLIVAYSVLDICYLIT